MSTERQQTTKQEWELFSGEIQEHINEILDAVGLDIETANLALANHYQSSPDTISDHATRVVNYFNEKWEFHDDIFLVSGQWHEPTVGVTEEGIISRHVKKDVCMVAHSAGFAVKSIDEGDKQLPKLGMSFVVSQNNLRTPSIAGNFHLLSFAELHEISLQYLRPGDDSVVSSDLNEVGLALERADSLLQLYLNHAGSGFYKATLKKQQALLNAIVDSIDQVMPSPDSYDCLYVHDAKTPIVYLRNFQGKDFVHLESSHGSEPFIIDGVVETVTVIDQLVDGENKRYTSPDELSTAGGGLSLVVKPKTYNFDLEGYNGERLLIPMRALEELQLSIA